MVVNVVFHSFFTIQKSIALESDFDSDSSFSIAFSVVIIYLSIAVATKVNCVLQQLCNKSRFVRIPIIWGFSMIFNFATEVAE